MDVSSSHRSIRAAVFCACLFAAAAHPLLPRAQAPADCVISGTILSSRQPLPGVVVTLADAEGKTVDASSSGPDGSYSVKAPASAGSLVLKASLVAFASVTRNVTVDNTTCGQRVD